MEHTYRWHGWNFNDRIWVKPNYHKLGRTSNQRKVY